MSKLSQQELNNELLKACHLGYDIEIVKCLVETGADVNTRDNCKYTPLHGASRYGHLEVVKYLVEADADVNARNVGWFTTLHYAIEYGHQEVVNYLVSKGGIE